uniref:Uncharacterized protein n=1 Tax=Romanomermis culicivorax TaxID=13658 RepID=A0A915J6L4_ROMCU
MFLNQEKRSVVVCFHYSQDRPEAPKSFKMTFYSNWCYRAIESKITRNYSDSENSAATEIFVLLIRLTEEFLEKGQLMVFLMLRVKSYKAPLSMMTFKK